MFVLGTNPRFYHTYVDEDGMKLMKGALGHDNLFLWKRLEPTCVEGIP